MKRFRRIEPTYLQDVGRQFTRQIVVKTFEDDQGLVHEFTTYGNEGGQAVFVVGITSRDTVVMVRQFRPGPEMWLYDFPCGGVEPGETPAQAANREFREGTGYSYEQLEEVGTFYIDAYTNRLCRVYYATGCESTGAQQLDPTEQQQGLERTEIAITELPGLVMQNKLGYSTPLVLCLERLGLVTWPR